MSTETYGITRAALEIGYDNGAINRYCTEAQYIHNATIAVSTNISIRNIMEIDRYLSHLSQEDLNTLCCGEQSDVGSILETAPTGTDFLLEIIFNKA